VKIRSKPATKIIIENSTGHNILFNIKVHTFRLLNQRVTSNIFFLFKFFRLFEKGSGLR